MDGRWIYRHQHRQKIIQTSIKHRTKIIPGGVLERLGAVLGRLGGLEPSSWRPGAIEEPSQERLGVCRRRLGGILGASWERLRAFGGRPGSLFGRLGASRELLGASLGGSGVVVYLKRLESSKLLFFPRNFNDFVARSSNLVGRTSSSMGRDSIYVGRNSSSGGS